MSNPFEKLAALKGQLPPGPADPPAKPQGSDAAPLAGKLVVRRERKGRGGKTVTLVQGVALQGEALAAFARDLKKALGCGATVEETDVVLQGDLVDRVVTHLQKLGAGKVVRGSG